nr:hypothetical protein [uncultured Aminipila sp.]
MILKILYEGVIVIGIIYLYILLCKYLNLALKNNKIKNNNFIIINNETSFIENEANEFIVNSNLINSLYIENNNIYIELTAGDVYLLKQCKDNQEAKSCLNEIQRKLNSSN